MAACDVCLENTCELCDECSASERVERCFSLSSDDDHFSPEADAAMSEMTGNTALLAQVCGAGGLVGLSQEPPPGASSLSELSWLLVSRPIAPAFPWPTP